VATPRGADRVVAVIGVGLMGGSLGLAARELAGVRRVVGYSRSPATLAAALERGAITEAAASLEEAASAADLVFVCTPVRLVVEHVRRAHAVAGPDAVVSDVGSTKAMLMEALTPDEQARCVGGHPLWAVLRGTFQMRRRPWVIGGLLFQLGFFWALVTRTPRIVSAELMAFHRAEQLGRLKALFPFPRRRVLAGSPS